MDAESNEGLNTSPDKAECISAILSDIEDVQRKDGTAAVVARLGLLLRPSPAACSVLIAWFNTSRKILIYAEKVEEHFHQPNS